MSVVGIIAEYNPFHKGHAFHIAKAKEVTGADYAVVVMSGDFVQRGEPAIIDKYSRARMALQGGADLVLELPVYYSTASAESFATGAILLLEKLGIIDYVCFGSEQGQIQSFQDLADTLLDESEEYRSSLQSYLKQGYSFPKARSLALGSDQLLETPNNILALEYCKALKRHHCHMKPVTIVRKQADYHDTNINQGISSATAIREAMRHQIPAEALPESSICILKEHYKHANTPAPTCPIYLEDCRELLFYKIMEQTKNLHLYGDITPQLADRMTNLFSLSNTLTEYGNNIKNKSLTAARINRCFMHILLNVKKEDRKLAYEEGSIFYGRLLGFRKSSAFLLRLIHKTGQIPVITKVADGSRQLTKHAMPSIAQTMWQQDIHASHIYQLLVSQKYGTVLPNEYQHGPEHMM